jgi:hypothetical protein
MLTWNATYFRTFDDTKPAERTTVVIADDQPSARKVAIAGMGDCVLVYLSGPVRGAFDADVGAVSECRASVVSQS